MGVCGQNEHDDYSNECEYHHKCTNCGGEHSVDAR